MAEQCNEHLPSGGIGSVAAERLGISTLTQPTYVYIGEQYVEVVGPLRSSRYQPTSTDPQLWGNQRLKNSLKVTPPPQPFLLRVENGTIDANRALIPATADPENPEEITVSRPSDALEAQAAADDANYLVSRLGSRCSTCRWHRYCERM